MHVISTEITFICMSHRSTLGQRIKQEYLFLIKVQFFLALKWHVIVISVDHKKVDCDAEPNSPSAPPGPLVEVAEEIPISSERAREPAALSLLWGLGFLLAKS